MSKLLIVEDDAQVRAMLRESLVIEGFEIVEAENGRQALDRFRAELPDLVITDIIMPEQDGVETIHALRKEFPKAKIIAISGGSAHIAGDYLLGTAGALGAVSTFEKPLDMAILIQAIRKALA